MLLESVTIPLINKYTSMGYDQKMFKDVLSVFSVHSGQSTHFKGWGFEILKNCKRVGVHIFPLKRVD